MYRFTFARVAISFIGGVSCSIGLELLAYRQRCFGNWGKRIRDI